MKRLNPLPPILEDPDDYGQAGPPEHFEPTTPDEFFWRLELGAGIQLGNVDELLLEDLGSAEPDGMVSWFVGTCYHEAGHAVAMACGFCDTYSEPSELVARGAPDAEQWFGHVAARGRSRGLLQPWQLTLEAVTTCAAAVVEARLAESATVHICGDDAEKLESFELFGAEPRAVVERKAWALVLSEWERIERLAVALAREALASPLEDGTLVGRLSWERVLEVIDVPPPTGRR